MPCVSIQVKHRAYLCQRNTREKLDKFSNRNTIFEVLEKRCDGNPRALKHPSSTDALRVAFYFGTIRPVHHNFNISTKVMDVNLVFYRWGEVRSFNMA